MYKTIEECQKEIQRFAMQIDIQYAGVYSILDIVKQIISIVISSLLYGVIALDGAYFFKIYKINKELLIIINIIIAACIVCKTIMERCADKNVNDDYAQAKLNMCERCFKNYEGFEELADSEKSKIFEEDICKPIGLIKIK